MKIIQIVIVILTALTCLQSTARADCAGLIGSKIQDTEIKKAEPITLGASFNPSDQSGAPPAIFRELPAFCRVVGVIRPTTDSEIGFELWLPELNRWNGRYLQVGNGGFAGLINYGGLVPGLRDGFAVASTDDGHNASGAKWDGSGAKWALGHAEKVIDYGYRAVHLTSAVAKQIVTAYYTRPLSHTYFSGCSDGGRESLMEAQRYPDDFDGWVVGAPGNDFTGVMTYLLNLAQIGASMTEPLTPSQLESLSKAALTHCDAADGISDGVIENPLQCHFEPRELQCKGAPDGRCLSASQAEAVVRVYSDTPGGKDHTSLAPGFRVALGDEVGQWPGLVGPTSASQFFSENFWPFMVYVNTNVDFRTLDLWKAATDARSRTGPILNSVDPDLSAVRAAGKKIIQYHGWADAVVPPQYSIGYYEAVEKYLHLDNRDFYRLFLAPGMEHCAAGPGPNAFGTPFDPIFGAGYDPSREFNPEHHVLAALVKWVEEGVAPDRLVATKYRDDDGAKPVLRTRPLCVYPKVARWIGKGSSDDAKNFICAQQ